MFYYPGPHMTIDIILQLQPLLDGANIIGMEIHYQNAIGAIKATIRFKLFFSYMASVGMALTLVRGPRL